MKINSIILSSSLSKNKAFKSESFNLIPGYFASISFFILLYSSLEQFKLIKYCEIICGFFGNQEDI